MMRTSRPESAHCSSPVGITSLTFATMAWPVPATRRCSPRQPPTGPPSSPLTEATSVVSLHSPAPSVVLLRQLPDIVRAADVAALLLANLTPAVTSALGTGAFVVLTPKAVRVRYLPLR